VCCEAYHRVRADCRCRCAGRYVDGRELRADVRGLAIRLAFEARMVGLLKAQAGEEGVG
jgi:hypothetical protein